MDKPTKLILDYSKWRCGGNGKYKLGEGEERLLNKEGFMCAEGQWHMQLGATKGQLLFNPENESIDPLPFSSGVYDINEIGLIDESGDLVIEFLQNGRLQTISIPKCKNVSFEEGVFEIIQPKQLK